MSASASPAKGSRIKLRVGSDPAASASASAVTPVSLSLLKMINTMRLTCMWGEDETRLAIGRWSCRTADGEQEDQALYLVCKVPRVGKNGNKEAAELGEALVDNVKDAYWVPGWIYSRAEDESWYVYLEAVDAPPEVDADLVSLANTGISDIQNLYLACSVSVLGVETRARRKGRVAYLRGCVPPQFRDLMDGRLERAWVGPWGKGIPPRHAIEYQLREFEPRPSAMSDQQLQTMEANRRRPSFLDGDLICIGKASAVSDGPKMSMPYHAVWWYVVGPTKGSKPRWILDQGEGDKEPPAWFRERDYYHQQDYYRQHAGVHILAPYSTMLKGEVLITLLVGVFEGTCTAEVRDGAVAALFKTYYPVGKMEKSLFGIEGLKYFP